MFKNIKDRIMNKKRNENINENITENITEHEAWELNQSLDKNKALLQTILDNDDMVTFRDFETKGKASLKCFIVCVNGMVNNEMINENIIQPVTNASLDEISKQTKITDAFINKIIVSNSITKTSDVNQLVCSVLYGDTILLIENETEALIIDTKGWGMRGISEPLAERVVRGPREGFTESVMPNLALIRKRISNPDLKFQFKEIGVRTKTKTCLCYINGLVNPKILQELMERLDDINIDGITDSGMIEELIKDAPLSPFATIGNTERPDVVVSKLLEGRIALVCDGTPFVLTLPYLFIEYFQANEDYYNNYIYGSINRLLKGFGFFLSTSVPAVYVALITFHQEMIPTPLILSVFAARQGIPFPTVVEAVIMLIAFEILREGGIRLPGPIGSAIGFVGALIIGQAAVEAKFVSAPMIIIVALTGISNFLVPKMFGPLLVMRLLFLISASFLGLFGYLFGVIGLFIHLMSIRSFGLPYMLHTGDLKMQDIKDTTIRAPWWTMKNRPKLLANEDSNRQFTGNLGKKER